MLRKLILSGSQADNGIYCRRVFEVADKFDPYREALVVEKTTIWPADSPVTDSADRQAIANKLHADPASCAQLEYIRVHTGFCRKITVTAEDLARVGQ
jgi:hypothetical protein